MTATEAIDNAVRLMQAAEGETNPVLMECLGMLAASWVALAQLLNERELH